MKILFQTLLSVILLFALTHTSIAQMTPSSIKGKVMNIENQPILFANVALYNTSDSTIVKVGYTLEDGSFLLPELDPGNYWLKISFVGYSPYVLSPLDLVQNSELALEEITMLIAENELETFTVESQKPLLEIKKDRVIFNVSESINSIGINTLDLLRKSPNVMIDKAGNIRMMGRSGAIVAVNGKILPLTGGDLTAYLETIQTDQIESIELVTDPGAQFDAVGTAGVINIVLRKNSDFGANGSFVSGYSIGNKSRYNTALSGNYRSKLFNIYGSYSFNRYQNPYQEESLIRQNGRFLDLVGEGNIDRKVHAVRAGMDFNLSPKSVIGFLATGSFADLLWDTSDQANFGTSAGIEGILNAASNNVLERTDHSINLNYRYQNENGTIFNIDADYASFQKDVNNRQPNTIFDPAGENIISSVIYFISSPTSIDIKSIKADNERTLGQGKLSLGVKLTDIQSDNRFGFFREENGNLIPDLERSNDFLYKENISAAYASYFANFGKKFKLVSGLRAEYTQTTGELQSLQIEQNASIKRNYLDFFPNLNLTFLANEKHSWSFNANRRINRPNYNRLNPFQLLLNEFTYSQGNPFLLPEYATAFTLAHDFKSTITSSITYNEVKNHIGQLYLPTENNKIILTQVNLEKQSQITLNVSAPLTISDWWEAYGTFTGFYIENKFDTLDTSFDEKVTSMSFSLQNTFTLPKAWKIELSGFYNSPSLSGVNERIGTIWTVDIGASKSILKNRGFLTVGVSDIFRTNVWPSSSNSLIISANEFRIDDTRRLLLSFNYNFGNSKIKGSRRRTTGLDEERRRSN